MKLKKIVLAMLVIALVFVAAGCPMTVKEFKQENGRVEKAKYDYAVESTYKGQLNILAGTLRFLDVPYNQIESNLKTVNENLKLNGEQKYYGVTQKKIVYTGEAEKKGLKTSDYTGKTQEEIAKALEAFFKIQ